MSAIIPTTNLLAIQKICAITICKSCKIGLPSERSAKTHLVEKHYLSIPKARSQAKKASDAANAALSEPHPLRDAYMHAPNMPQSSFPSVSAPIPSLLPPLDGIETATGYQCVICASCYISEKRIRDHFAETHSDHPAGIDGLWGQSSQNGTIRLQSLFGGNKTMYFPVSSAEPQGQVLTAPVSSTSSLLESASRPRDSLLQHPLPRLTTPPSNIPRPNPDQHLFPELDRVLKAPANRHSNDTPAPVNPFLARTLLDQHLNQFGVPMEQAANYSALLPDRTPVEKQVVQDVTSYLLRVPNLIMDISQSVLRDVNLRGYKEFTAVSNASAERYARNFARIVISANRLQDCSFFPPLIRPKVAPYFNSLQNPSTEQAQRLDLLHDLLSSITFQTLDNIDSPRNLFIFQFITFASVLNKFRTPNHSFRYADASDISHLFAALLYGATSCALTEIHSLGLQARQLPCSSQSPPASSQPSNSNLLAVPPDNETSNSHPLDPPPVSVSTSLPCSPSKEQLNTRSQQVLACFDESKNSAPSTIRRMLTMAHEISKADDVKFSFDSCQEHNLCGIVKNVHIKMKDLGNITKSLHQDIRALIDDLTYGAPLPDEFFSNIAAFKDSIQDKSPGSSFLVHPDNLPKMREYTLWLFRQLTSDRPHAKAAFSPSPSTPPSQLLNVLGSRVKRIAVQEWLAKSKILQEKLLAALHISSGSPGRATELETLCLFNTSSHLRNVYISQGRMMVVTRYVKQRWLIGGDKVIPRFPDPKTSKLLLTYLVLFRPLEALFIEKLFGEELSTTHMSSLFTERGIPFSAARIRDVVSSTFHANDLPILFNHLRTYSAGIAPTISENSPGLNHEQLVSETRAIAHLQAGHSPETAEANYARRSDDVPSVPISALNNYRLFSNIWHTHLGLAAVPVESSAHPNPFPTSIHSSSHPPSLPSSFTTSISEKVASTVKIEFQKFTTALSISKRSSSSPTSSLSPPTKRPFLPRTRPAPPRNSLRDLNNFLPFLRALLADENACFASEMQLHVTAAIKENEHNLLVLMPTGAGKSLTVFLPAAMESTKSTVIVVPLATLVHEHVSTCSRLGISVATWENRHTEAQVYVVSMDHTVQELRSFLLNLQEHQRLVRVVIDEAHLLLFWFTFRTSIQRLPFALHACAPSVQLVLLTATLPPLHKERLLNLLSIPSIVLYASPTSRSNLRFTVVRCSPEQNRFDNHRTKMTNTLSTLLRESLDFLLEQNGPGKILIFALYRHETEQLQREIQQLVRAQNLHQDVPVRAYHAAMSATELKSVYDFWKSSDPQVKIIVATSAFGTGLDVPDVRFVFHFGGAAGLLQYAQEAGRAGRDGMTAQCTIIYNKRYADEHTQRIRSTSASPSFSTEEFLEDQAHDWNLLRDYMDETTKCRKNFIYSFIDGDGPGLCLLDKASENCDVCDDLFNDLGSSHTPVPVSPRMPLPSRIPLPASPQLHLPSLDSLPSPQLIPVLTPDQPLLTPPPSQDIPITSLLPASPQLPFPLPVSRRLSFSDSPSENPPHLMPTTHPISTNPLQDFRSTCRSFENLCIPCLVYENKEELQEHRCKHMRNRCRRCFHLGHQVTSCTSFNPKRKNHCYSCSLNQMKGENVHQAGEFGRMCFMGVARDIAWAFWGKGNEAREQLATSLLREMELRRLEQAEQNTSTETEVLNFYNTWLRTSWDGIPNLIRFFLWWYNTARLATTN